MAKANRTRRSLEDVPEVAEVRAKQQAVAADLTRIRARLSAIAESARTRPVLVGGLGREVAEYLGDVPRDEDMLGPERKELQAQLDVIQSAERVLRERLTTLENEAANAILAEEAPQVLAIVAEAHTALVAFVRAQEACRAYQDDLAARTGRFSSHPAFGTVPNQLGSLLDDCSIVRYALRDAAEHGVAVPSIAPELALIEQRHRAAERDRQLRERRQQEAEAARKREQQARAEAKSAARQRRAATWSPSGEEAA